MVFSTRTIRIQSRRVGNNSIKQEDVNGAYNIMKKALLNAADANRIEDVGLHSTRWRLAAVTSKLMPSCE